ncbi:MAG TPA: thioredoxin family protein [Candidatus Dormibacteraeota bacterium]|jgi:hypothetical protein|nr:thioredoxin family protein [Candidatus Dormibacteraeota bacterium]
MSPDVAIRALAALAFLACVALVAVAARRIVAHRRDRVLAAPAHPDLATGRLTILYFHGDRCSDCVVQERELDVILTARPEIAIRADHAPSALSRRFGVLTVPTTVVLDGAGRARAVNYGLTARDVLERQLGEVSTLEQTA